MLDIRFVRDNPERVKEFTSQKGYMADVDQVLKLDADRRELQQKVDELRAKRNDISSQMKGGKPEPALVEQGRVIKTELAELEDHLRVIDEEFLQEFKKIPNAPGDDVPIGLTESENVVIKEVGDKPEFTFTPKNHYELAKARGWIDKERAAKVAGARFAYLKGDLVKLQFALIQFVIDTLTDEVILREIATKANLDVSPRAFTPILPPLMIRTGLYDAMDRLEPSDDRYKIEDEDLWLQGSAEHVLGSMHADEIFAEQDLPLRYLGYATSFRREAGTYGKDMEGIFRMHQFDKLEMESFTTADAGPDEHIFMVAIQEYLLGALELPYQVLQKCTGDIGKPNARGVDMNTWLPGQNQYRETHTADYMTDYQARRLQTRVRKQAGIELIHTNDATAFAMGRTLIAIIENYQNEDNTVRVPKVLQNYLGGREVL